MDVVIRSFSYNADIKPVVQWIEVESGNCLVNYYVEVTSSTGAKVQRGPITGSSVIVDDFNNPKHVTVFAMNNGTFPKGYFVGNNSWQSGYQPKGSQSTPLEFTITTTTTTTTTQRPTTGQFCQQSCPIQLLYQNVYNIAEGCWILTLKSPIFL